MYSTIIPKKTICIDCSCNGDNSLKETIAGRCKAYHYKNHLNKKSFDKRTVKAKFGIQKAYENLKKNGCVNKQGGLMVSKTEELIEQREHENSLKEWFAYHMVNSKKICENCNADLSHYNEWAWRGSQHHLLEKSLFPSVASELENHAVLGYYCCHGIWHSSYKNAMQMPIWNLCVQRVQSILYLVKEKHKILDLFNTEIENKILNEII